ncbi:MAG: aconitase/3-isopropylmalate dehydratase large subunit family protein [Planctomycetes bacterium]|jgi:homoaconitate hydratase family protein/3-isopropylmalate dehydratase small subunit|nr:aconitase/3-isopropylmalate dehydratase large subunit family protein [Planctomycetota bacterium]
MTAGRTVVEKILAAHSGTDPRPGAIVDVAIDVRVARDFGGANVVKNLRGAGLAVSDPARSFFTFDCNPGGSDQKYAANQQICREFAREQGVRVFDIDRGIGTHVAIDEGLAVPGSTLVSTDSHANLLGAIGAFGQGMGDLDVAHAFAHGRVWFKVPPTVRVVLRGRPGPGATAKDLTLAVLRKLGASGLLGVAAEFSGEAVDGLGLAGRITMASMATEMGAIIALFEPDREVIDWCSRAAGRAVQPVLADPDAEYAGRIEVDVDGIGHLLSRPGHPEDVIDLRDVAGRKIGSAFIGSCTNGRIEDLRAAAAVLRGRRTAPGVVLKIVPATDRVWREALREGLLATFKEAGALVGNAGCAGCAEGQIGQNGPGEVSVSTGNRNFPGKQGKGEVWLCSPAVAAASAVAGAIAAPGAIPEHPAEFASGTPAPRMARAGPAVGLAERPVRIRGRVVLVARDNIDTDMIFHNRHLAITELAEMGRHTFGNLPGFTDFAARARPGDIVIAGGNFGCGSSRQQAVDCFRALGVGLLVAKSFGAIYERNAINSGFPILAADLLSAGLPDGAEIEVDLVTGEVTGPGLRLSVEPFSPVQLEIYRRGGLLR